MSPDEKNPFSEPQEVTPVVESPQGTVKETKIVEKPIEEIRPTVIMTNQDAYIHERMKGQPETLDDVRNIKVEAPDQDKGRLDLPEYFKKFSFDHTKGEFIFYWLNKDKRAIDRGINVRGWLLVNRRYFPDAPKFLFSANGGVEFGDSILVFMQVKKALALREAPGMKSRELVQTRTTEVEKGTPDKGGRRQMGHEDDPNYYAPKLSSPAGGEETTSPDYVPPGAVQEDDF